MNRIEKLTEVSKNIDLFNKHISFEKGNYKPHRYEAVNSLVQLENINKQVAIEGVNFLWDSVEPDPALVGNTDFNHILIKSSRRLIGLQVTRESNKKSIVTNGLTSIITELQEIVDNLNKEN